MRKIFQKLFSGGQSAAEKLRAKQLRHAQTMQLEHQSAADYHQAMSNMYSDQQLRLTNGVRIEGTVAELGRLQAVMANHQHCGVHVHGESGAA